MADLNKDATLGRAKKEFGSLSEAALKLYWAALQNGGNVPLDGDGSTMSVAELIKAKMAEVRRGRKPVLSLTYKARVLWPVPADKVSRIL